MNFSEEIRKRKPTISEGTVKSYNSMLRSIHKNVFKDEEGKIDNFSKSTEIMQFLMTKPPNTRKTNLASLLSIFPDVAIYKTQMNEDIKKYKEDFEKAEMTDKLKESAISEEEIDGIYASLKSNFKTLMKKQKLDMAELMEAQQYVILSMYHGHILPRRSTDYILMKYKSADKKTENYVDMGNDRLVFNVYKTAMRMGETLKGRQELDIPRSLRKILKKWIAVIPEGTDYLFFNNILGPLSNVTLAQRLNKIFGAHKSVNSLRHFYLTKTYSSLMQENEKMADEMGKMGSDISQAKNYVKK
jgi:hypothetical protein